MKIKETCVSCPTCLRPLSTDGPGEKKIALAVASNRRNSLLGNIVATREQIAFLERNKQDKGKLLLAEIARNQVAVWMDEEAELHEFIRLHDSFRAKERSDMKEKITNLVKECASVSSLPPTRISLAALLRRNPTEEEVQFMRQEFDSFRANK